jgi:hypothetical protein
MFSMTGSFAEMDKFLGAILVVQYSHGSFINVQVWLPSSKKFVQPRGYAKRMRFHTASIWHTSRHVPSRYYKAVFPSWTGKMHPLFTSLLSSTSPDKLLSCGTKKQVSSLKYFCHVTCNCASFSS